MKKMLTPITLSLVAITVMGLEQEKPIDDGLLKMVIRDELCSGHHPPIEFDEKGKLIPYEIPTAESIARGLNISSNRMARVLEEMVHETLSIVKKMPVPTEIDRDNFNKIFTSYNTAALNVFPLIEALQSFHGTNTVALLKESVTVNHNIISRKAVEAYIVIEGAETLPFFREVIKDERLDPTQRNRIIQHLQGAISKLEEKKQTADVEKIATFLKEMKQTK